MKSVQVGIFKAEFSEILHQVKDKKETFVIEYGRNHQKVAMLVPYQEPIDQDKPRIFGYLKHQGKTFQIQENFEISDDEFLGNE